MNTLRDVLEENVRDLYSAEIQSVRALARMGRGSSSRDLRRAFEKNWMRSRGRLDRLEQVCDLLRIEAKGGDCAAMRGLIAESGAIVEAKGEDEAKDAALISSARKMTHYAIAVYGTARTLAGVLEENKVANLLQTTLDEEIAEEGILTEVAAFELGDDDAVELDATEEYEVKHLVLVCP